GDLLNIRRIADHRDDDVRSSGDGGRACGFGGPFGDKGLDAGAAAVPDGELIAGTQEVAGHRPPHDAQAYEAYAISHGRSSGLVRGVYLAILRVDPLIEPHSIKAVLPDWSFVTTIRAGMRSARAVMWLTTPTIRSPPCPMTSSAEATVSSVSRSR